MFMSEHILLNTNISVLQQVNDKKEEWEVRDVIFTDRAFYIFAQVQNQREQFVNLQAVEKFVRFKQIFRVYLILKRLDFLIRTKIQPISTCAYGQRQKSIYIKT